MNDSRNSASGGSAGGNSNAGTGTGSNSQSAWKSGANLPPPGTSRSPPTTLQGGSIIDWVNMKYDAAPPDDNQPKSQPSTTGTSGNTGTGTATGNGSGGDSGLSMLEQLRQNTSGSNPFE